MSYLDGGTSSGGGYLGSQSGAKIRVAAPLTPPEEEERHGLTGLLHNAWDDVVGVASGVGQLAGMGVSDLGQLVENGLEAVHLNSVDAADKAEAASPAGEFNFDDVVKNLPHAVAHDYATRYGGLNPFDKDGVNLTGGDKSFGSQLYANPLSFLTDALTLATGGGALAAKGAGISARAAEGASLAAEATDALDAASAVSGVGEAAEAGGGATRVLDTASKVGNATLAPTALKTPSLAERIIGTPKMAFDPATKRIVEIGGYSKNPVTRFKNQGVMEKLFTKRLDPSSLDSDFARVYAEEAAKSGVDGLSVTRQLTPNAALRNARKVADMLYGSSKSKSYDERNAFMRETHTAMAPLMKETEGDTATAYRHVVEAGPVTAYDNTLDPSLIHQLPDAPVGELPAPTREAALAAEPAIRTGLTGRFAGRFDIRVKHGGAAKGDTLDTLGIRIADDRALTDPQAVLDEAAQSLGGQVVGTKFVTNDYGEIYNQAHIAMPDGTVAEVQMVPLEARSAMNSSSAVRAAVRKMEAEGASPQDLLDAKSFAADKWERVRDQIKFEQTGTEAPAARRTIHDMGDIQARHYEDELIRDGQMNPADAWRNRFKTQQIRDLQARGIEPHYNVATGEYDEVRPVSELNAERIARGEAAPAYVPMVDQTRLKMGDLLVKQTRLNGALAGKDKNLLHNTGDLIARDLQVKDVELATAMRASRAISYKHNANVVTHLIKQMGRPVDPANPVLFDGEVLMAPKLIFGFSKARTAVDDTALAKIGMVDEFTDGMRSTFEGIMGDSEDTLAAAREGNMEVFAVPRAAADRIQQHASANLGKGVRTFYQSPMQMWKNMVLVGSPKWIENNIIGSAIFSKMQGAKWSDVLRQLDPHFKQSLIDVIGPEAEEAVAGGGFTGAQFDVKLGSATSDSLVARATQRLSESAVAKPFHKYADLVRNVQAETENAFRRAGMAKGLERQAILNNVEGATHSFWTSKSTFETIAKAGADDKMVLKAAKEMNEFANDYTALTPFEANIVKPYIAPFYSFYKHSAKLLLTLPYKHPEVYTAMAALDAVGDQMVNDENLPGWMRGNVIPENGRWTSTASMNPFNVLTQPGSAMLNPLLKVAVEQGTGRSMFNGQQFTDRNTVTPYGSDQGFKIDPSTGQVVAVDKTAPSILEHLLQQIPQYEIARNVASGGHPYDTSTLLDALKGNAQEYATTGPDGQPLTGGENASNQLAKFLGYPSFPYDQQARQDRLSEQQQQVIEELLARAGR